jgi:hypothetical protein
MKKNFFLCAIIIIIINYIEELFKEHEHEYIVVHVHSIGNREINRERRKIREVRPWMNEMCMFPVDKQRAVCVVRNYGIVPLNITKSIEPIHGH